jgi:hypothetical protein
VLSQRDDLTQITGVLDRFDLLAVLIGSDRPTLVSSIHNETALLPGMKSVETFEYLCTWIV